MLIFATLPAIQSYSSLLHCLRLNIQLVLCKMPASQVASTAPHSSLTEYADRVKKLRSLSFLDACQEVDDLYTSASEVHGSLIDLYQDLQKWIKSHKHLL